MTITTKNENETYEFAKSFAKKLKGGDIVCLNGDLGAGKTVFVKGVCDYFGVKEYVNSPTYALVNEYHGEKLMVYHMDLYRIEDEDELYNIGFYEFLESGAVVMIEWAENAAATLDGFDKYIVNIKRTGESREIEVRNDD